MAALILPGQEFEIEVQGLKFTVKALAGKQQIELVKAIKECSGFEDREDQMPAMEATEQILIVIFGEELGRQYWDMTLPGASVDVEMAHEIASLVLARGRLSEDDAKNLPSPHSSCAANSVKDADETAGETLQTA